MRPTPFIAVFACTLTATTLTATILADATYEEASLGDLSNSATAPTEIALDGETLTVSGSVQSGSAGDTRDYFTFTVPAGQNLVAMNLVSYADGTTGQTGNRGYVMIDDGSTSVVPSFSTTQQFLGGSHLLRSLFVDESVNMLTRMSAGTAGGTGFTLPLGPGDYTINVQQTGGQNNAYTVRLVFESDAPSCPTDFTNDGVTDGGDLGALLGAWGDEPCEFDLSGDGRCDGADLGVFLSAWGSC